MKFYSVNFLNENLNNYWRSSNSFLGKFELFSHGKLIDVGKWTPQWFGDPVILSASQLTFLILISFNKYLSNRNSPIFPSARWKIVICSLTSLTVSTLFRNTSLITSITWGSLFLIATEWTSIKSWLIFFSFSKTSCSAYKVLEYCTLVGGLIVGYTTWPPTWICILIKVSNVHLVQCSLQAMNLRIPFNATSSLRKKFCMAT